MPCQQCWPRSCAFKQIFPPHHHHQYLYRCFVNHAAKDLGKDRVALAEDVEKEEEEEEAEAEQDQGLVEEEEEEEEEEEDVSEEDHGLEDEESDGVHCDIQDDNLATGMQKSENGTNGTEAGADDWSCDQNLGEEQCLRDGEEDEALVEEEEEAFKTYNLIATELGEDDEDVNNSIEDDEEDFSEGGEVDNCVQEVVDEELGLDDEEQGVDQQDYDVVDEELSVGDEVDEEEQGGDQQQDDEVGEEESPTEDENDHKTAREEGGMNCELKQESLEENEPKSEEHHENLEEHKFQEINAFVEGRMDEEDPKKKNKTNYFELDEAPLEPENLMLTTTLSTSSKKEKGGFDVKPRVQFSRLDQGGNLKKKIERADSKEGDAESFSVETKEARGPMLMFSTLGKNVEEVEEITDEENEVMELELEVEELDCALQKKLEDKNKQLDLEDEEEDDDEELEDKERNLLYDSFEEKLQNIFRRI